MNILTKSELEILLKKQSGACVSIFMPTHRIGAEVQQDKISLKNLLRQAEERLVDIGLRRPEAIKLLAPIYKTLNDDVFWQHPSDGLAIFLSPEMFRYYRVPFNFERLVVVSDRFHIKPLLPVFSGNGRFYILALSQNQVRLLQCTRFDAEEIDLAGIAPKSLTEALKYDEMERQNLYHTGVPGVGKEGVIFHGQDIGDIAKNNILRYSQQIDRGLHREILKEEKAPLILAGVDYLQSYINEYAFRYNHRKDETPMFKIVLGQIQSHAL